MRCLYCGSETKVVDSRENKHSVRRRRECQKCDKRFTTYERAEIPEIIVIKKDGREEIFNRAKILKGILKACRGRNISMDRIEEIVSRIEKRIKALNAEKIESKLIGDMVMEELKNLDKVAYVRFAIVYQDFEDLVILKDPMEVIE